jgi:hypothetical protein
LNWGQTCPQQLAQGTVATIPEQDRAGAKPMNGKFATGVENPSVGANGIESQSADQTEMDGWKHGCVLGGVI